jgi:hypothetical protein
LNRRPFFPSNDVAGRWWKCDQAPGWSRKAAGGRLEIKAEIADGQLTVHVLDNGVGFMPKNDQGVGARQHPRAAEGLVRRKGRIDHHAVPPSGGTCATINVPYEVSPTAA